MRRKKIAEILAAQGGRKRRRRGTSAQLARELGVSEATISRDLAHPSMLINLALLGGVRELRQLLLVCEGK